MTQTHKGPMKKSPRVFLPLIKQEARDDAKKIQHMKPVEPLEITGEHKKIFHALRHIPSS